MRKFLIIVVCVITICGTCIYSFAEETNTQENSTNNTVDSNNQSNDITVLQSQSKELQNQIEQAGEKLTEVQDELTENLEQVQKIDEKIEKSEEEIKQLKNKIEKVSSNTKNLEARLTVAQKNYEKQKSILEARLIEMYESGETEYLDVILSSTDISSFLSNYVLITEIASYDTELLEDVEEKKQIIELAKQKLDSNLEQLTLMKANQERTAKILENTKILRNNYIEKLTTQEQEVQKQIDEYKSQFEQVNKEIVETALSQGLSAEYVGGVMAWPIPGYTKITSNYGMRVHPITGVYKLHTGVDVSAPIGADFVAANDGIVTKAYYNAAYGNMVMVDHGGGISTLYAHGSEILVEVGQMVKRGEPVLKVGSTGYSTGPHAHFEVRINGEVTNPIEYITSSKIPESVKKELTEDENNTVANQVIQNTNDNNTL